MTPSRSREDRVARVDAPEAVDLDIRHADGIVFDNVKITVDGEDYRPALVADDVNGLRMKNLQIDQETAPKGKKQIITKDTKNIRKK